MEPPSLDLPVSTLYKGAISHGSQVCWGNTLEMKQLETVHIIFQNIAGLSKSEVGEMKLDVTQQWIIQNKLNVFACVEQGTCWDLVDYQQ